MSSSKNIENIYIFGSTLQKKTESEKSIGWNKLQRPQKKLSKLSMFGDFMLLGVWFSIFGGEAKHGSVRIRQSLC